MNLKEFNVLCEKIIEKTGGGDITLSPLRGGLWAAMTPEKVSLEPSYNAPPEPYCTKFVKASGLTPVDALLNLAREMKVI